MKGIKILIGTAAVAAVGAGATGLILNSKKMKMRRVAKKTSNMLYTAGTILRALSCQMSDEE